jgi:hypothetical protein
MMSQKSKQNAKNICIQLTTTSPYLQYTSDVQATLTGRKEKEEIQTCAKKLFSISNHMKFINFKHSIVVCPLKFSLVFFRHYFPTNQQSAQSLQQQQQQQQLSASAALDKIACSGLALSTERPGVQAASCNRGSSQHSEAG